MTQLDRHIARVEQYGFDRALFPLWFNGHRLELLKNDAHPTEDDRIHFHFTLWCSRCHEEGSISGRFPAHNSNMVANVTTARALVFENFNSIDCQQ